MVVSSLWFPIWEDSQEDFGETESLVRTLVSHSLHTSDRRNTSDRRSLPLSLRISDLAIFPAPQRPSPWYALFVAFFVLDFGAVLPYW